MCKVSVTRLLKGFRGDGFRARAMRGSVFTVLNFGGQNALRLASNLVLTRLLFPEAFGLMALVQVMLAGVQMLSDIGIRDKIIQDPKGDEPHVLNTAWVLQIIRGIFLWLVVVLLAAPVAGFYEAPELADLLPVAGIAAVAQGLSSTKVYAANKRQPGAAGDAANRKSKKLQSNSESSINKMLPKP